MSYNEQLQELYRKYEKAGHAQPFTMHETCSLGVRQWSLPAATVNHSDSVG
jgi:hypothetical protein